MTEQLNFLSEEQCRSLADQYGTPLYIYSQEIIERQCQQALDFPNNYGLTVRYALKANPNSAILKIIDNAGLHFDASSEFEVKRCLDAGIAPEKIQLTGQQMPKHYLNLIQESGVRFNACSLRQLELWGQNFPGTSLSIRINPGLGSGSNRKTNVGGPSSSFGIWHEQIEEAAAIIEKYNLDLNRIHTHIGSGSDPEVWKHVAQMTLAYAKRFPSVETVNLGGGYKVGRMASEKSTCLQDVGSSVTEAFAEIEAETGRKLHLEIEPGTYIIANSGSFLAEVDDVISTGDEGYDFLKLNTGMDALTRPALYASAHPLIIVPKDAEERGTKDYVVCGHCCESGDVFTLTEDDSLEPRTLTEAQIGDIICIEGTGAYCASMSLKGYNSFPAAAEVLIDKNGNSHIIREAQPLAALYQNESIPAHLK